MAERGLFTSNLNKILLSVFFLFFLIFISTLKYRPYPLNEVIKIVPILSLAVLVLANLQGKRKIYMAAGLLFSAMGDVLLALSGDGYFIYGLGSFAVAHCFYITAFLTGRQKTETKHFYYIIPLLLYSVSIACILYPGLDKMTIPVFCYLFVITVMGVTSASAAKNFAVFITGASLFIISDSIIAVNTFLIKVPNSSLWIMITYYPAQLLLTLGMCLNSLNGAAKELRQE